MFALENDLSFSSLYFRLKYLFFSRPFQSSIDYSHCDIWKPWRKWVNFLILLNPRLYRISPFFALRVWMVTWPWPQSFFSFPFVGSARTRVQKRRTFIDKPNDNTIKRLLVFVPIELGTRNQKKKVTLVRLQLLGYSYYVTAAVCR